MKYITGLDALRALAVAGVILFHFGYLPCGWVGVQIFFVLSGFLITGILDSSKRPDRSAGEYFSTFYWRRTVRIFPLYYGFLFALATVYWLTSQPVAFGTGWLSLFTYTTNIARTLPNYDDSPYFSHFWSLAVEEQFYLFWPAVVYLLSRRALSRLVIALIICAPAVRWLTGLAYTPVHEGNLIAIGNAVYNVPWSHLDAFGCGAAAALGMPFFTVRPAKKLLVIGGLTFLAGMGMIVFGKVNVFASYRSLGWPPNMPYFHQYVWGYTLLNISAALLIVSIARRELFGMGFWENSFLTYCGKISYGLYVWHDPIQAYFRKLMHIGPYVIIGWRAGLMAIFTTFVVAMLSFHLYEQTFLKLKDLYFNPRRKSPRPPLAEPAAAPEAANAPARLSETA